MTINLPQSAKQYARLGWHVFPLKVKNKKPATRHGLKDATPKLEQINQWWSRIWYNIGVSCGASGLLVVDIDTDKGGDESWKFLVDAYDIDENTIEAKTGSGGRHIVFAMPEGYKLGNSASKLGKGVDTRGWGGYIVAAPSVHPNGNCYKWIRDPFNNKPLVLPDVLIALLITPQETSRKYEKDIDVKYLDKAVEKGRDIIRSSVNGTRNHNLNRVAFFLGTMIGRGRLDKEVVEELLLRDALSVGLNERESLRTINSGVHAGMRKT